MRKEEPLLTSLEHHSNKHRNDIKRGELFIWFTTSIYPIYLIIKSYFTTNLNNAEIFAQNFNIIFATFFLILFPIIFGKIFEYTPLLTIIKIIVEANEASENEKENKISDKKTDDRLEDNKITAVVRGGIAAGINSGLAASFAQTIGFIGSVAKIENGSQENNLITKKSVELLDYYAAASRDLSSKLFSRAGVYLLVGLIVAFTGLGFFYTQTIVFNQPEDYQAIYKLIPNIGILFFIEFIAFFFLRQYRSAMDEFRYYEAIKRKREEIYVLVKYANEEGKSIDPLEFIKNDFFSKSPILHQGETTEIIESKKLEKSEIELLEKIISVINK